jgi:hypothetical protein
MPEPDFIKLRMYIMLPEAISTAYFTVFFFFLVSLGGVRLSPLGMLAYFTSPG